LNGEGENKKMLPFKQCPVCGGEVVSKEVEKLLRGGVNTAIVTVQAEVCLHCGERLYSKEVINFFEQIRAKLARQDVSEFQRLGQSFQVVTQARTRC
jgi:YgiT-type zinc finger domain-containing protein